MLFSNTQWKFFCNSSLERESWREPEKRGRGMCWCRKRVHSCPDWCWRQSQSSPPWSSSGRSEFKHRIFIFWSKNFLSTFSNPTDLVKRSEEEVANVRSPNIRGSGHQVKDTYNNAPLLYFFVWNFKRDRIVGPYVVNAIEQCQTKIMQVMRIMKKIFGQGCCKKYSFKCQKNFKKNTQE